MPLLIIALILACVACSPNNPAPPTPDSPSPGAETKVPSMERPREPLASELTARQSPILWPQGDWTPKAEDSISLNHWIGGVAGTDSTTLTLRGDGKVTEKSGRQGGPGGRETDESWEVSPEQSKAIFLKLRDSKILDQGEESSGTTGSTLSVQIDGRTDSISVAQRRTQADELFSEIKNSGQ